MKIFGVMLVVLAFAWSQYLIGGARLLYSLPAYGLLGLAGVAVCLQKWRRVEGYGVLLSSGLFFGYVLLRGWFSPVDYLARADFFSVVGGVVVYLLTVFYFAESRERMYLFWALLLLALGHGVVGAIQFKEANQFYPWPWIQRNDYQWRASGFYICPNHLAGLLEVVVLMALSVAVWSKRGWVTRVLSGYGGGACLILLGLTGSRGGYVALIFGAACFVLQSLWACRSVFRGRLLVITVGVLIGIWLAVVGTGAMLDHSDSLKGRFAQINDTGNIRVSLWRAALEQFEISPVWGTGAGTYLYYGRQFRHETVQNDPVNVHNDYLHLLAEYGAVGGGLFLVFLVWHMAKGLRAISPLVKSASDYEPTSRDALALHLGAMSSVCALAVHSVVDFNLHIPANVLVMAWVFGIVANPGLLQGQESRAQQVFQGFARFALAAIALLALGRGLPLLPGEWHAEWARQALRDRRLEEARTHAAEGLRFERFNPDLYYYAGEAVALFESGLEVFPEDSRTLLKLAQSHDQLREFELAEVYLEKAQEIDPNSAYVRVYFGLHYQAQGMVEEAQAEYAAAASMGTAAYRMALQGLEGVSGAVEQKRKLWQALQAPAPRLEPLNE